MINYFLKGGPLMWPILLCSLVALGLTIERTWAFRRFRVFDEGRSILEEAASGASGLPRDELEARLSAAGSRALRTLSRGLDILALVGRIAPMIGLLGTVLGLTDTFRVVSTATGGTDPSMLAGGIWEALITTVGGLFVAIPALIAHHFLDRSLAGIRFDLRIEAEEIAYGVTSKPSRGLWTPPSQRP
jgi:biopolymer transport protein ExbB